MRAYRIYIYICTHISPNARIYGYMQAYTHKCEHLRIDASIYDICAHLRIYASMYAYMRAYTHLCVQIRIYARIDAYMCSSGSGSLSRVRPFLAVSQSFSLCITASKLASTKFSQVPLPVVGLDILRMQHTILRSRHTAHFPAAWISSDEDNSFLLHLHIYIYI